MAGDLQQRGVRRRGPLVGGTMGEETVGRCIALPSVAAHFFPRMFEFFRRCLTASLPLSPS
jgi:hypothetical protein